MVGQGFAMPAGTCHGDKDCCGAYAVGARRKKPHGIPQL